MCLCVTMHSTSKAPGFKRCEDGVSSPVKGQGEVDEGVDNSLQVLGGEDEEGLRHYCPHLLLRDRRQPDAQSFQHFRDLRYE